MSVYRLAFRVTVSLRSSWLFPPALWFWRTDPLAINLVIAQLSGAVLYFTIVFQAERWALVLEQGGKGHDWWLQDIRGISLLCSNTVTHDKSSTGAAAQCKVSSMLRAFASVVRSFFFFFMLWVCVCMYVRQVPGCSQVDRQLQQRAEIKKVQLAPGAHSALLRYVPLAVCHKHTHTPTRITQLNPVECNKYTRLLLNNCTHIFLPLQTFLSPSAATAEAGTPPPALLSPLGVQVDTIIRLSGASPFYNWI